MRFNLELVRNQLVTKQQTIASDYGIQHADRNPEAFARQIVTALNQPQYAIRYIETLMTEACIGLPCWPSGAAQPSGPQ